MSLSSNTLNRNLKSFVVSYFCISSYLTFAGQGPQLPSLKTGWDLGKNQIDYARERIAKMSRQDREQLENLQLQEILPSVIYQQLPWYVLKEVGFSLSDDNLTRAQKYIRLAQMTKFYGQDNNYTRKWIRQELQLESLDSETINQLTYESYKHAFASLKVLEPMIKGFDKLDYYTSLAQIELWTAHALLGYDEGQLEKATGMLFECFRSLKDAEEALREFPSGEDVIARINALSYLLETRVEQLPDNLLKKMAADETTKLSLADESDLKEIYHGIVENQLAKARKSLTLRTDISESIKLQTLENFRALKLEKLVHKVGIKTREEKLKIILAQKPQDNWLSLINLGSASKSDCEFVEKNELLAYANLLENYRFALGCELKQLSAEKIENLRDRFARKHQDLGINISKHLQEIKEAYASN